MNISKALPGELVNLKLVVGMYLHFSQGRRGLNFFCPSQLRSGEVPAQFAEPEQTNRGFGVEWGR